MRRPTGPFLLLIALGIGCTRDARSLSPEASEDLLRDAGASRDASAGDASAMDGSLPVSANCPDLMGQSERTRGELQELAIELAPYLAEGSVLPDGRLQVERVWRGFSAWEGQRIAGFDPEAFRDLHGRWLVGFTNLPYFGDRPVRSTELTPIRPRNTRGPEMPVPNLPPSAEVIAVVQVEDIPDPRRHRINLRRVEALRGTVPERFYVNIDPDLPNRPGPSDSMYLVSTRTIRPIPSSGALFGAIVDFRPDSPEARRAALAAQPTPELSRATFERATAWNRRALWRLSPHSVTTEVIGLANECDTGLGGSAEHHRVLEDLQGGATTGRLVGVGGHGFFTRATCGDRVRLALASLPNEPANWSCPGRCTVSYYPGTFPLDRIEPSDPLWSEVELLARAPAPPHLASMEVIDPPYPIGADGPWSAPESVAFGLSAGELVSFTVAEASELESGARLDIEISLDLGPVVRRRVFWACPDPRLLRSRGPFWAPLALAVGVSPPFGARSPDRLFFVSGVLLDDDRDIALARWLMRQVRNRRSQL